jgi:preprotein translocase subunit SecA
MSFSAYYSLQDELMVRFGSERLQKMMNRLGMDDSTPIESKIYYVHYK